MNFPAFVLGYKISDMGSVSTVILDDLQNGDQIVTIEPYQVSNKEQIEMMKESMFQRWLYGKLPKPIKIDKNIHQERLLEE
ncbi:hypothetical protein [Candidatus Nitrosocosmicus franklandus]|uniref:Uncharacterized protein n=1 Tax=Candidatus Nitrosocosmicus franklandianus TaxID=1798806 RepID=A0A484I3L6_9ARCH|nr:hypothetical protein [Candidatus Nitrosocosmicus franklandus]VFJ12354.1 protein of unknown function [Candidatus Nitrosocosmicus franklandus]